MKTITHKKQQEIWEKEHKKPFVLLQMDSDEASSGVIKFFKWLEKKDFKPSGALEIGCGKGRNVIWLAKQGIESTGIDFSSAAIKEAKRRAKLAGVNKTHFLVHDVTKPWPFKYSSFDVLIDCFATTDIESVKGRNFASKEMHRILKPGGFLLAYLLSTDDEFHKEMIKISPAKEKNAFLNPKTGKFEKTFEREEILSLYKNLTLVKEERVKKIAMFFGKEYKCKHHWMIFQKSG